MEPVRKAMKYRFCHSRPAFCVHHTVHTYSGGRISIYIKEILQLTPQYDILRQAQWSESGR